ncbi:hypothetical protein Tco_0277969 [Tanacetum coccineum]
MKVTGRGNRNENTHISDSYDDAFTATSKEHFSVCDTGFVDVGEHVTPSACATFRRHVRVDTPECTMIPQSAVGTDVHSNLPSVNGRPHVREENQRNYIAQRRQPSHSGLPKFTRNGQPGGTSFPNLGIIMLISGDDDLAKYLQQERITKKRTKNKAKTTKPDSEWKRL